MSARGPRDGPAGAEGDGGDDPTLARLRALGRRVELVATDPDAVRAPWARLARPVLRRIGWQPRVETGALAALLAALRASHRGDDDSDDGDDSDDPAAPDAQARLPAALEATLAELEKSVAAVERACVVNRRPQVAHAAWLRRLLVVVARARAAARPGADRALVRVACAVDSVALLPPLSLRVGPAEQVEPAAVPGGGEPAALIEGGEPRVPPSAQPDPARLLELELGAVDHLIATARAEPELLARRRRLLEAARQLLLEVAAALPLDPAAVEARRAHIARSIARIDRLEAAGLSPEVALLHQARSAAARGERDRLHAALVALDDAALARGDAATAARTGRALAGLWRGRGARDAPNVRGRSILRSAEQLLGADVVAAVEAAYARGAALLDVRDDGGAGGDATGAFATMADAYAQSQRQARTARDADELRRAREYLAPDGIDATLAAAVAVDGCFEVGGVLAPVRVVEHEVRARAVRHPTQELVLAPARDVEDLAAAVIDDPRTVLLDLAAGRLLTRRYVAREPHARARTVLRGEVRVYVLDGSGSMVGPRARVRDALLLAELATLIERLGTRERTTRVQLFFRYFNEQVGPTTRVDSVAAARAAIGEVLGTVRFGGTDIQAALLASFEQVRAARGEDPELLRAQIVLVTDGEAHVDEAAVARAQAGTAGLPVGLSVIALGEENPALRALVARQRARGERAFYHFVDDAALAAIVDGEQDPGPAVHLPDAAPPPSSAYARELSDAVGALLDEVATLGRARDVEALEALEREQRARREVGLRDEDLALSEGERARVEALHRDHRALSRRFARWFPAPAAGAQRAAPPPEGTPAREDFDAVVVALATVGEVVAVVGGSALARQADAIELLERLLPDARLSPARYEAVLARCAPALAPALEAVHAAVSFGLGGGGGGVLAAATKRG